VLFPELLPSVAAEPEPEAVFEAVEAVFLFDPVVADVFPVAVVLPVFVFVFVFVVVAEAEFVFCVFEFESVPVVLLRAVNLRNP